MIAQQHYIAQVQIYHSKSDSTIARISTKIFFIKAQIKEQNILKLKSKVGHNFDRPRVSIEQGLFSSFNLHQNFNKLIEIFLMHAIFHMNALKEELK